MFNRYVLHSKPLKFICSDFIYTEYLMQRQATYSGHDTGKNSLLRNTEDAIKILLIILNNLNNNNKLPFYRA